MRKHESSSVTPFKDRKTKTVIVRHTERRSPQGNLIASSKSKTTYIDGEFTTNGISYSNDNFLLSKPMPGDQQSFREECAPNLSAKSKPVIYNYKFEPRRICPSNSERSSNERRSLDEESTTDSSDTYVKQALIVGRQLCHVRLTPIANLTCIIEKINHYRRIYKVPIFQTDDSLIQQAKICASQMVLNKRIRTEMSYPMNIWTGKHATDEIAGEWNHEMSTYWNENIFKRTDLSRIGIGRALCAHLGLEIIVAVYQ